MKKAIAAIALLTAAGIASAYTFWDPLSSTWMGTVCRNGGYFTDYTGTGWYAPLGSVCSVRDSFGRFLMPGNVTTQ